MIIRPRAPKNYKFLDTRDGAFHVRVHHVTPQGFRWGRAAKRYVAHCASHTPHRLPMLAHHAQIPFEMLRCDKARYDALDGPVPASYLRALGVDFKVLQRCVGIDRVEYCRADPLTGFPSYHERSAPSGTQRLPFPAHITTPYHALALLLGKAARADQGTTFKMTWPNIKTIEIPAKSRPKITLRTRRPVLYCNGAVVPNLGRGKWDPPAPNSVIEFRPTDALPFIEATARYSGAGSSLAAFMDPDLGFGEKHSPTPEQHALYSPLLMILDAYDPALAVDSLRGYFGDWCGEVGFLEYSGEAVRILHRFRDDATFSQILEIVEEALDPGPYGMGININIPRTIVQELYNARQLYRGEPPTEFPPLKMPVLEELPPMLGLGVE